MASWMFFNASSFQRFFIGIALGITSLQLWAGGKVVIFVLFEQDGKKKSVHRFCGHGMVIFYDFFGHLTLADAQSYRGCRTVMGVTSLAPPYSDCYVVAK
jgi:hypothetical protein